MGGTDHTRQIRHAPSVQPSWLRPSSARHWSPPRRSPYLYSSQAASYCDLPTFSSSSTYLQNIPRRRPEPAKPARSQTGNDLSILDHVAPGIDRDNSTTTIPFPRSMLALPTPTSWKVRRQTVFPHSHRSPRRHFPHDLIRRSIETGFVAHLCIRANILSPRFKSYKITAGTIGILATPVLNPIRCSSR